MTAASTTFTMVLFDDETVKKKLMFMNQMECMFDDSRNDIPDEYYSIIESMKPGDSLKISITKGL